MPGGAGGQGRGSRELPACPRCECMPGYVGSNCSEDFDDCQDHRCQNNARCLDEVNGYSCLCTEGYRYSQGDGGAPGDSGDGDVSLCRRDRSWLPHPSIHPPSPVQEEGEGLGVWVPRDGG